MDELDLVDRSLAGEARAIESLVERFQADVFGLCVRLLHHRQDAEDVTQEVFLRVFRSLHRWDRTRPLRPWVMGIAVNRCRTWMGRKAKRPEPVDYMAEVPAKDTTDDSAELTAEIRSGLSRLRAEYRTVFVLFHEQGESYENIAGQVGRPVGTIKTWLHRARAELLEYLRSRGFSEDNRATTDRSRGVNDK